MLRSSLCDYKNASVLKGTIAVKGTITVSKASAVASNNVNKKVIFKNCAPLTNYMTRINNTQLDDLHDIDVVMSMYNLIEYSDNYLKTFGFLWYYCRDEPA